MQAIIIIYLFLLKCLFIYMLIKVENMTILYKNVKLLTINLPTTLLYSNINNVWLVICIRQMWTYYIKEIDKEKKVNLQTIKQNMCTPWFSIWLSHQLNKTN